jgi:hypothetical protein
VWVGEALKIDFYYYWQMVHIFGFLSGKKVQPQRVNTSLEISVGKGGMK